MNVIRGYKYDGIICVGDMAFHIDQLIAAVHTELRSAGCGSGDKWAHPFHLPPFFKTGSPYGDVLLKIAKRNNIKSFKPPKDMDVACVPSDGMHTEADTRKAWPKVFDCDFSLEYPNGKYNH